MVLHRGLIRVLSRPVPLLNRMELRQCQSREPPFGYDGVPKVKEAILVSPHSSRRVREHGSRFDAH